MAHFAKLDENDIVIAVHVVDNETITVNGVESEVAGIDFLTQIHGHSRWRQTSYNGNFGKNFAGIGYKYDALRKAFIPPKQYPSWTLNEETCLWDSPVPKPTGPGRYEWDELTQNWFKLGETNE